MKGRPWKGMSPQSLPLLLGLIMVALVAGSASAEMASYAKVANASGDALPQIAQTKMAAESGETSMGPATISEIKLEQVGPLHASLLIQADRPVQTYESFALPDPPRLVLDIPNAQHAIRSYPELASGSLIQKIRSSQYKDVPVKVVRLVFELNSPAEYKVDSKGNQLQVNLGGDKKVVTVLFSDIRNFTRISETLPPDQLVALLNEYFTEMARIIFENQGSLDKYIGDAIVAVFGSLIPLENPGRTAVQAAIQMMKEMSLLNERWKNKFGFRMDIGIGINTGEVCLGNIGSPERMEFTVIGDTVNIASRFSGVAKGGQILITKDTLVSLGSDIGHMELEPVEVKGKTGRLEVFEIVYQ